MLRAPRGPRGSDITRCLSSLPPAVGRGGGDGLPHDIRRQSLDSTPITSSLALRIDLCILLASQPFWLMIAGDGEPLVQEQGDHPRPRRRRRQQHPGLIFYFLLAAT
eukprot:3192342-Pyramimonas_sp.AAC.1